MATVLRVDHNADVVTTYFRDARSHRVFNTPAVQPHTVIHCADAQAVFASVRQHLNHYDVDLVLAAGHGLHDRFEGHDGNPIWSCTHNPADLAGTVVHLLACDTAISLGPTLVAHHAKAFWGYVAPFTFLGTRDHPNPANDPESAPFLEMALQVDLGLLRGDDRATIFAQVSQSFAKAYNKLSADGQQRLFENFNALRCIEGGATYQPSSPGP